MFVTSFEGICTDLYDEGNRIIVNFKYNFFRDIDAYV